MAQLGQATLNGVDFVTLISIGPLLGVHQALIPGCWFPGFGVVIYSSKNSEGLFIIEKQWRLKKSKCFVSHFVYFKGSEINRSIIQCSTQACKSRRCVPSREEEDEGWRDRDKLTRWTYLSSSSSMVFRGRNPRRAPRNKRKRHLNPHTKCSLALYDFIIVSYSFNVM